MRQMNTDDGGEVNMFNLQTEVNIASIVFLYCSLVCQINVHPIVP